MYIENLPDHAAELKNLSIPLPELPGSANTCPVALPSIAEYVSREAGVIIRERDLIFIRNAQLSDVFYWIWSLKIDDTFCYVTVAMSGGEIDVGYSPNFFELSPEQFIIGDYFDYF